MTNAFIIQIAIVTIDHFLRQPVPIAVLILIAALLLGAGRTYGITWLVWAEGRRDQAAVGAALGLLWAAVLFVAFAVDQQAWLWAAGVLNNPQLAEWRMSLDSAGMLLYWAPVLLLTGIGMIMGWVVKQVLRLMTPPSQWHPVTVDRHAPLLVGLAAGLVVGLAAAVTPAILFGDRDSAGGVVTAELLVFTTLALATCLILGWTRRTWRALSPAVSACALLGFLVLAYGVLNLVLVNLLKGFVSQVTGVEGAVGLANATIVLIVFVVVVKMGWPRYRVRFPELAAAGYYEDDKLVDLNRPPSPEASLGLLNPLMSGTGSTAVSWGGKMPLVLVATSGGGVAAAAWTVAVLTRLEALRPQFPYHVRLVTGASGGMVGASYYVSTLCPPTDPHATPGPRAAHRRKTHDGFVPLTAEEMYDRVAKDCLSDVIRHLVFSDIPKAFRGFVARDRGQILQDAWTRYLDGALDRTFRKMRCDEAAGWLPSLTFSPMMVEDGRRLLVSNLDLAPLGMISSNPSFVNAGLRPTDPPIRMAAEALKLFPAADQLTIGTAARMSASFPLVSPAGVLPTIPRRRVVDAGYYDNYGVNLAMAWIAQNQDWIVSTRTPVSIVEIRAFPLNRHLHHFDEDASTSLTRGLEWGVGPLSGLLAARWASMAFRNEEQVHQMAAAFTRSGGDEERLFSRFVIECPAEDVPLSWYLTARQREQIRGGLAEHEPAAQLEQFCKWWDRSYRSAT